MRRITKIELGVVGAVLLIGVSVLISAIQQAREAARCCDCIFHLRQFGLGFRNHQSALNRLPSSSYLHGADSDAAKHIQGWGWAIAVLPYMEPNPLYECCDLHSPPDPSEEHLRHPPVEHHCPAFGGNPYVDMTTKTEAITNCKAIGGTHLESLNVASAHPTAPRYGDVKNHPDGAIFPGSTHGLQDFTDGTSCTFLLTETVEQNVARWVIGNEACLVGLPSAVQFSDPTDGIRYYHPVGFTANNFWRKSTISAEANLTYLDWDCGRQPYDDGGISTPSAAATGPIKHGPSSHHNGVTNHLFADGSVKSIRNEIDAAAYMFLITRKGGEPTDEDSSGPMKRYRPLRYEQTGPNKGDIRLIY